jgi:hypothetical protein
MADSWNSYPELVSLAEEADGGLKESLSLLAVAAKPLDRDLLPDEMRVEVARGYDGLASRRIDIPWTPIGGVRDALGRWVIDIPPYGFDLSGAAILPGGVVVLDDTAYISEFRSVASTWRSSGFWGLAPEDFGFAEYNPSEETCVVSIPEELADLPDDAPYFLFNSNLATISFSHFVHDLLCQVIVYDHISHQLGSRLRPLLLRSGDTVENLDGKPFKHPMMNFLFEEVVAPLSEVFFVDEPGVRVARCYGANCGLPDPDTEGYTEIVASGFSYARQQLAQVAKRYVSSAPTPRQIYVSRGDAYSGDSREFHNISEAEELIAGMGFRGVTVEQMPIAEALAALYFAEHMAGIHGANLMNFMFAPRLARLTELINYPYSWPSIAVVAAAMGVDVRRVEALPPSEATGGLPALDLDQIEAALSPS